MKKAIIVSFLEIGIIVFGILACGVTRKILQEVQ